MPEPSETKASNPGSLVGSGAIDSGDSGDASTAGPVTAEPITAGPESNTSPRELSRVMPGWADLNGTVLFYTAVPLPGHWPVRFGSVALLAPMVGVALGGLLAAADGLLRQTGLSMALVSALVVFGGALLTGGLHVDGVMDTADGLAVMDPERRLTVMADSRSGAFGVMAAIALFTLKILALLSVPPGARAAALIFAMAWGRWGQQWAIGCYPYLKPRGKGAFHKQAIPSCRQAMPWAIGLSVLSASGAALEWISWSDGLVAAVVGLGSAGLVAGWLNRKLGGHTGDTYGAVVEWVEVAILVGLACISQ